MASGITVKFLLIVTILVTVLGSADTLVTSAQRGPSARITATPKAGLPGQTIRIRGSGFVPGTTGHVIWDSTNSKLATVTSSADGTFTTTVVVPQAQAGEHTVRVLVGAASAKVTFTVKKERMPESVSGSTPRDPVTPAADRLDPTPNTLVDPTRAPETDGNLGDDTRGESTTTTESDRTIREGSDTAAEPVSTQTPVSSPTATESVAADVSAAAEGHVYVAPGGSDSNPGTSEAPLASLQKALDIVTAGNTITLRGGTYSQSSTAMTKKSGNATAPITITAAAGERAVIAGPSSSRGLQINHSWYIVRALEFTGADILLWLDGAHNVMMIGNVFHDAGGECVRVKNQSSYNTFSSNRVWNCGLEGFNLSEGSKNGEGVYIGTAPEQRYKIGGVADRSTNNIVENNVFQTNGSEAVDIKEDSERNIVRYNVATGNRDAHGANFGSRGDYNQFIGNDSSGSAGAGFRTGGDTVDGRVYGQSNLFRGNSSYNNAGHGYKFMVAPQDVDCSNVGWNNGGELYYFGTDDFTIVCNGEGGAATATPLVTSTSTPATTSTPAPTVAPTSTPQSTVAPTSTPQSTPSTVSGGTPSRFMASGDARVRADHPTKNYGNETTFRIDARPDTDSYIQFRVAGSQARQVQSARIRFYVTESGKAGTTLRSTSTRWSESTITYRNRPAPIGPVLAALNTRVASGIWVEFDVTAVVKGDGVYAFVLNTTNTDGVGFASSEAQSGQPQLIVTYVS